MDPDHALLDRIEREIIPAAKPHLKRFADALVRDADRFAIFVVTPGAEGYRDAIAPDVPYIMPHVVGDPVAMVLHAETAMRAMAAHGFEPTQIAAIRACVAIPHEVAVVVMLDGRDIAVNSYDAFLFFADAAPTKDRSLN